MRHGLEAEVDGNAVTVAIPVTCPDQTLCYEVHSARTLQELRVILGY